MGEETTSLVWMVSYRYILDNYLESVDGCWLLLKRRVEKGSDGSTFFEEFSPTIISKIITNNHWLLFIMLNGVLLNRDCKKKIYLSSFK